MDYSFTPRRVCAKNISFTIEEGKIHNVSFVGGCNGNLKAIGRLVEGKEPQEIIDILKGNDCNGRGTSCADQFAIALQEAIQ